MESPRPRSFAGLMELYESNYIQFRRLCPDFKNIRDEAVSQINGAPALYLRVLERSRHTSTLSLTYYLEDSRGIQRANPDFRLRIYHDALQAQALNYSAVGPTRTARMPPGSCRTALARAWVMNRFLSKWLTYCLDRGHRFSPVDALNPHAALRRAPGQVVAD
jgi:uncharacterized protein